MAACCLFATNQEAEPYQRGTQLEEKDGRVLVQPASGGDAVWMPKTSVFLKSPDPTTGESCCCVYICARVLSPHMALAPPPPSPLSILTL